MSVLLLPDFVILDSEPDYSGRVQIVGRGYCDTAAELPTPTTFADYTLREGSLFTDCSTADRYIMDSTGSWTMIPRSPFSDVYTKSEIDTMLAAYYTKTETDNLLSPIRTDLDAVIQSNSNQSLYLYALIGQSSLNLLDSSVWSGQTPAGSGYICQDLSISLSAGTYAWKMQRDGNTSTSFVLKAADDTELYRVNRGAGVNDITQIFTISAAAAKISIYAGYSVTYHDNMIFKVIT